ncbi:glycosyltransferase family 1 protein [Haloferax sp. Atlit-4N]|uniref:glycosyltransferase family 4 protein n=1 Tax=Haloferax sp. Atlit-4N TaxID=2077206 RepID=UPI000E278D0E|nr:glycosyltransferase family 4 protein [Haloferax sp. Atlit-4N]RDZ55445.1 glycosyltransferase family 1 protein [Haloferax sp. Atlit-4N]
MNVLYVTTRYPPHTGGVEAHVAELATRLAAVGHDVTVLTADAEGLTRSAEYRDGVRVIRHPGVAPGGAFHVAPEILATVRRLARGADLVHAHNYHSLPLLFAALGTGAETPFVATPHYHGGSASDLRDKLLSVYRVPGGWALRRADARIAVSDWERRQLEADFGVEATVIPNGLDVSRFAEASPDPEWADRDYLLSVGRLAEYKGVQHVIRALPGLDYDLVVAGSGDYGSELKRLAREVGVEDRVHFLGFVDDEDLPGLYAGAAAFVTMSEFEAYGMTVAEALAAGTPCVVRNAGALVDWADRDDCVGVDPAALVSGIERAVDLDAPAEPLPTWESVVERTTAVYDTVCRGGWNAAH